MLRFAVPALFVVIWSTGFIVAKLVAPRADLEFFLILRFALTALVMGASAVVAGREWPRGAGWAKHFFAGVLMQGVYLCASYWGLRWS